MNYLIFEKYKDKIELTESWFSTHDFLPLVKASLQRYTILSLSEFLLFFSLSWGFYEHTLYSGFLLFPTNYSWSLFSKSVSLLFIQNVITV